MTFRVPTLFTHRWFYFLVIAGLIIGGYLYWQASNSKQQPLKTYTVKRQTIVQTVTASGKITAAKQVSLKFPLGGYINWVGVKKGDNVKQWQAIASVDQQQLEKQLKNKLLDYMRTRTDFEQLRDDKKITDPAFNADALLSTEERRVLEKSQYGLDQSVLNVEITTLAKQNSFLVTPIDGVVVKASDEFSGVNASATTEYVVIDPTSLQFSAEVEEMDIAKISNGNQATITLDALPDEKVSSTVSEIEFTPTITNSGNTAYKANLPLTPDSRYRLAMNGDVTFVIAQKDQVLVVPTGAIEERSGKRLVKLAKQDEDDTMTYSREVTTGIETDEETEILTGLSEGETIVIP